MQPNGKQSTELKREREGWRILTTAVRKKGSGESIYGPISGGGIDASEKRIDIRIEDSDRERGKNIMNSEYSLILPRSLRSAT